MEKDIDRIVCSAIYFEDGVEYVHQPLNVKTGFVVCGHRHHNCFQTMNILDACNKFAKIHGVQGFLTKHNKFVDRKEGAEIAFKCGQTDELKKTLYSEDLY